MSGNGNGRRRPTPLPANGQREEPREAPRPERRRSRAARNPILLFLNLLMTVLVIAVLGGGALAWLGRDAYLAPGPSEEDQTVLIVRGTSVDSIAQALEERGIVSSWLVFRAASLVTGKAARIKAGEYSIPAHASMAQVLDRLVEGRVVQHPITVPEGLSSQQVVEILQDSDVLTGTVEEIPPEGTLLPETYLVERGTRRTAVLERMQAAHAAALAEVWENRDPDLPIDDPRELLILASIVEKETGVAGERPLVAGVFHNRLRRGMRLQSDPTILYGIYGGDAWDRPRTITRSELDRPNPWNTYQIDGLPPGPIANPGRAALEATANPQETDALFFVADGTGGHAFARTLAEHNRNVAAWRELERRRGSN